jgi:ABC-2 type transport system ATP-binding protein
VNTGVQNAVEIRGLIKTYGETHAVAGVDLDVRTGEVFALLGPNGAGKSTTIEILEGYRDRDGGTVSVLGEDPSKAGLTWRNKIGIVLQNNNDASEITVEEILNFFSDYYANPRNVDEVINAVGLEEKRKSRGRELSGGQRRRLDVALGILGNPELLFLDEPTTGFDPEARRAFWDLIRGLRADGTTILLTTHYLDEAEALADRVGVINHGRIIEVATPSTLGGRDSAKVIVRWSENGSAQEERTDSPTEFLRFLDTRFTGEIPDLTVSRPTLEDIYISMIEAQG